jgi:hypothetical protein
MKFRRLVASLALLLGQVAAPALLSGCGYANLAVEKIKCPSCGGSGLCSVCGGDGLWGFFNCPTCSGGKTCKSCGGIGFKAP